MNIKTKVLLISTLFAILLASCKKNGIDKLATKEERTNELRFFQINGSINSAILRINKSLKEQNEKSTFISKFTKLAGYPKWDKGFSYQKEA